MSRDTTDLAGALSPLLEARGLDLVDVEVHGAQLTVFVDREGGVDLDELGEATRDVSAALDEHRPDAGPLHPGGLEPRARAAAAHARALRPGRGRDGHRADRRRDGRRPPGHRDARPRPTRRGARWPAPTCPAAQLRIAYDEIERARTVFEWGPGGPGDAKSERVTRP